MKAREIDVRRCTFDAAYAAAVRLNPQGVDRMARRKCAEMERDVRDVPTWADLAPLYGRDGR